MFWTIVMEILILWVCYAAYMAVLVHRRGPIGGIFFYPQVMIDRVKALGLITEAEFRSRKRFALTLLINHGFVRRRNFFRRIIRAIDLLPNSFSIAKKWNISDHDRRVRDGSITYDRFDVGEDRIEYRISRCVYVEMFETWSIRSLCKIFCMTDTTSYENLRRHVTFIRHSDLSDGDACHDEIIRRRKTQ